MVEYVGRAGLQVAANLASLGFRVHATDVAPGMLAAISEKAPDPLLAGRLSLEERSFDDLGGVDGAPYDLVFSNLGGLNCTDDIDAVAEGMQRVLKPRGAVVLVLMPPVCPWEVDGSTEAGLPRLARLFGPSACPGRYNP